MHGWRRLELAKDEHWHGRYWTMYCAAQIEDGSADLGSLFRRAEFTVVYSFPNGKNQQRREYSSLEINASFSI